MSRSMILEVMYEVIKDSIEWGVSCENGSYGNYVDGVMAMTEEMLKKTEIEDRCKEVEDNVNKLSIILDAAKKYTDEYEDIESSLSDELST